MFMCAYHHLKVKEGVGMGVVAKYVEEEGGTGRENHLKKSFLDL